MHIMFEFRDKIHSLTCKDLKYSTDQKSFDINELKEAVKNSWIPEISSLHMLE